jgi:catechol 2,3-dioxygenase-like lactoylglutathione lyase family enzyme
MSFPGPVTAITLFVDDVAEARDFYAAVFGLPVHYEDEASAVFDFGNTLINLLHAGEGVDLIGPAPVGRSVAGATTQLTITVDDVDATAALVVSRGAELLNGPQDRPWGIRTACFRDPSGHVWELASS